MAELFAGAIFFVVLPYVVYRAIRRRANMTPEERQLEDLQRRVRRVEREQRNNAWR